jgi:hypothetical protein
MIWIAGVILWALAEASFFFIVPDVLLTAAALHLGVRRGLVFSILAAASAVAMGAAMWYWAARNPDTARAAMLLVPAVGKDLLERAHHAFDGIWPLRMLLGALSGVPYKLYAVEAGARHIPLPWFLAASFFARLSRFWLTVALAGLGRSFLMRFGKPRWVAPAWLSAWSLVYSVYFTLRALA